MIFGPQILDHSPSGAETVATMGIAGLSYDDFEKGHGFTKHFDTNIGFPTTTNVFADGIKLAHDNRGEKPGWHIKEVKLTLTRGMMSYPLTFSIDQWLAYDEGWFKETNAISSNCIGFRCKLNNDVDPFGGWHGRFTTPSSNFWDWSFVRQYDKG